MKLIWKIHFRLAFLKKSNQGALTTHLKNNDNNTLLASIQAWNQIIGDTTFHVFISEFKKMITVWSWNVVISIQKSEKPESVVRNMSETFEGTNKS